MRLTYQNALCQLRRALAFDEFWKATLDPVRENTFNLHLAIFREPYLGFILEGRKTVETRFARRPCPPYKRVTDGDILILKQAGGPVLGVCIIEKVWLYEVDAASLGVIKKKFGNAICPADGAFWEERKDAVCATLMLIGHVTRALDISFEKRDRRGWVVMEKSASQNLLPLGSPAVRT